jgi:hypothetical protein
MAIEYSGVLGDAMDMQLVLLSSMQRGGIE